MLPEAGEFSPDERALLLGGDMVLFSDRIPDFVAPLLGIDPSVIRMERFRMYLDRVSEQQYRADADIGMASVREAKALNTIVRLAVLAERKRSEIAGKPGLLSEAEVTFVDSDVLIHGIILDLNTLTGLLAGLGNMSGNGGGNR